MVTNSSHLRHAAPACSSMVSPTLTFAARARPFSVVVADDVVEIQKIVKHWLSDVGCNVVCASTGNEAAKLIRAQAVDLVITDVIMPDGDGLEVIAAVRQSQPSARVLAISGGGNHLPAHDCLKFAKGLGAHAVLLKPFSREQLLEAVQAVTQSATRAPNYSTGAEPAGA